jgi:hypothetical protein
MPLHGNLPGKGFPEDFHAGPYPPKGCSGSSALFCAASLFFSAMRYKAQSFPSKRESFEPYISLQKRKVMQGGRMQGEAYY